MSYVYRKQWLPNSKYSIKCPYNMTAEFITIHNSYNDASASNEAKYHNSNNNQVSFHIAVDDIEAIEVVPLNRNAWHCGDGQGNGNRKSIGIEICYSKSGGIRYIKAEENAVQLTAKLLFERKWGIERVKKHQDWSGKYCPHRILDEARWKSFLSRVQTALNNLNNEENGGLTMSQYEELLNKITKLEEALVNKIDKQESREPLKYHVDDWQWMKANGITDGSNPQNYITREQVSTLLHNMDKFNTKKFGK
ncbi:MULTISPECIES: N-acetylmuramoyl-L-alanine amidase family protein [Lysinibacillus]|uniref:peptidoglycan recognition protein family protein n=1 Tax=Lysinibacillus TaxID=400634 RepID=UPI0027D7B24C|nr:MULTISPECIES: N-acetylmuramoyl-L-alanine amidase [Lysinibacillus]